MTTAGFYGQFGYVSEVTFGTAVTVDKFLPVTSASIQAQDNVVSDANFIKGGRRTTSTMKRTRRHYEGSIVMPLPVADCATLLTHMMGAVNTTGADPYTHTGTPGDLSSKSMTVQLGIPDDDGTVHPFTYSGLKIPSWSLTVNNGNDWAELNLDIFAKTKAVTTPTLATASYATDLPLCNVQASVLVGGSDPLAVNCTLNANNMLARRDYVNGTGALTSITENARRSYTGSITAEFDDLTLHNLYENETESALVIAVDDGTNSWTATLNVYFTGGTPDLSSADGPVTLDLPFEALGSTDAAACTVVLVNGDASAA